MIAAASPFFYFQPIPQGGKSPTIVSALTSKQMVPQFTAMFKLMSTLRHRKSNIMSVSSFCSQYHKWGIISSQMFTAANAWYDHSKLQQ